MNKILDANKFDKVQYPFLIKVLTKQGIEEKISQHNKKLYKILTANLIFVKDKIFPLRSEIKMLAFVISIQLSI